MKKKILALLLTVVMMFAMASVAWAAETVYPLYGDGLPGSDTPADQLSTYVVDRTATVEKATATVIFDAGVAIDEDGYNSYGKPLYVVVKATAENASGVMVKDILKAVNNGDSGVTVNFTPTSDLMDSVSYNGSTWSGGIWGNDGWMFNVNDKMPVELIGNIYQGTGVEDTPVKDGDIIHFYFNYPGDFSQESGNIAATYVRGIVTDNGEIQLQGYKDNIIRVDDETSDQEQRRLSVGAYAPLAGITAYLCGADGTVIYTATSNTDGILNFVDAAAGEYILKTDHTFYEGFPADSIWQDEYELNGCFLAYTGAYCSVVIK